MGEENLGNGIIKRKDDEGRFSLALNNGQLLIGHCEVITSLHGKFIATKRINCIIVFKPIAKYSPEKNYYFLEIIASLYIEKDNCCNLILNIDDKNYLIDCNAQISVIG